MKKLFLVVLAAGLFVACGNKTAETENVDTTAVDTTVVEEVAPECDAVAEEPAVAENTQAKPAATKAEDNKTIKETAKEVGTDVAKKAINKGGEEATKQINNVSTSDKGNR